MNQEKMQNQNLNVLTDLMCGHTTGELITISTHRKHGYSLQENISESINLNGGFTLHPWFMSPLTML